ncbi:MAG: LysM peptidoglycan-binding domain-containing protein [Thermodesulfovibrionales bacterium]
MRNYLSRTSSFFLLIVLFFISSTVQASIEYTVKKGDSLASIAKKYKVNVKGLKKENKVSARHMKPGTIIVIPGAKAAAKKNGKDLAKRKGSVHTAKAAHEDKQIEAEASAVKAPDTLYHTVRKGETIASISKKYAISTDELKELNNLKSSKLRKGRKLLVKHIGPKTYTVKKGDTLWNIAKKFDMEADDLMRLNEMESPSLPVGQKLYLEEKVDPATADTYSEVIGKRVNIDEELKKVSESEEFTEKPMPDKLVTFAKKLVNIPYKFGGNSILGIDCSAYVKKVYGLLGIQLPRTAREQFQTGETVDKDELSIGDLVFFRTYASFPSHVGIYLGNDLFIHASSRGKKVTIDSLETPYYLKRFIGGKRLLTEEEGKDKDVSS